MDGTNYLKDKVKTFAKQWELYANIHFDFVDSGTADARVSFKGAGFYSEIGTYCHNVDPLRETMNFGYFDESTPDLDMRATVLHELSNHRYDSLSIMHYAIPAEYTLDHFSVKWNTELSQGDKDLVREMYPFPEMAVHYDSTAIRAQLQDLVVMHNFKKDSSTGMNIRLRFTVDNARDKLCSAEAYFYDTAGVALRAKNYRYSSASGTLSARTDFQPSYVSAFFPEVNIFLPYDEIPLVNGEYPLKFQLRYFAAIRDAASGQVYKQSDWVRLNFTYNQ